MGQPVARTTACAGERNEYWRQSALPLTSLAFVAPLVACYEVGVWRLGPVTARNGADVWLRELLGLAGFGQYFLLPVLTCALLLAWHHARREPWRLKWPVLAQMWLEAVAWGGGLSIAMHLSLWLTTRASPVPGDAAAAIDLVAHNLAARFVGYLGAGIYEELLFRLLIVPPTIALLRTAGFNRKASLVTAIALTSLLFAAAHYRIDARPLGLPFVWPHGESLALASFLFRFAAGAALGALFAYRGFGIAVGAHALYDFFVLLIR